MNKHRFEYTDSLEPSGHRIAVIIDSLDTGGAERLVRESVQQLCKRGYRMTVVHLCDASESTIAKDIRAFGGVTVPLPATTSHTLIDGRRILRLGRLLREDGYGIVHTHLSNGNVAGVLAARLVGIPVVATLHSPIEHTHRHPRVRRTVETATLRLANRVVAVGPSVALSNRRRVWRPIDVLMNPVGRPPTLAPDERRAIREEISGAVERPIILGVGRLTPLKRWPDILYAFKDVIARHPDAMLAIAGTGELAQSLADMVRDLHMTECVRLLGQREDMWRLFASADIFAMSSECEGLPLALLEAMASSLPVVATDVGDIPTAVSRQTGILVPPRSVDRLSAALNRLLDDRGAARLMGEAARAHVQGHHDMDAWGDRLEALYDETRADRRPARWR